MPLATSGPETKCFASKSLGSACPGVRCVRAAEAAGIAARGAFSEAGGGCESSGLSARAYLWAFVSTVEGKSAELRLYESVCFLLWVLDTLCIVSVLWVPASLCVVCGCFRGDPLHSGGREGGSSAGVGRVPLCICEISVTEELVIGSGCFQESVYTLLPVPVDTHRSGAVGLWVPVSVNWAVGIHVRGSIWEPCVTPPSAALCPQAVEECVSGQHCVCLPDRLPAHLP